MQDHHDREIVLMTGCSGLIGSRLIDRLGSKYRIVGLDIKVPSESVESIHFIECDLTDDESIADAIWQARSDHGDRLASVLHLAAYYDFSGKPSPLYEDLTVHATRRLLEQLGQFTVEQFIFTSSLLTLQPTKPGHLLTEFSPTQAEWEYPRSKLDAETVIHGMHGEIPVVILRIAGAYDEQCHSIPIAQQMKRIYEGHLNSHFFPGNIECGQSFVHLDDLADCIEKTVARRTELQAYELFLIGESAVMSYGELQDSFGKQIHGVEWGTIHIPKVLAKAGAWAQEKFDGDTFIKPWMIDLAGAHYAVDTTKAAEKLDWVPKHRLSDCIPKMVATLKQDPDRWYSENGLTPLAT